MIPTRAVTAVAPTRRHGRRRLAGLSGVTVALAGLLGSAAPAAAADAPSAAAPTAEFQFACDANGPTVTTVIGNEQGTAPGTFTFQITGFQDQTFTLQPGFLNYQKSFTTVAEGGVTTFTVSEAGGWSKTVTFDDVDCYRYDGEIVLRCDGDQPYVDATVTKTGELPTRVYWSVGAQVAGDQVVTGTATFSEAVDDGEYYVASLRTDQDSYFAEISGIADCGKGTPTTTTTVPVTTTTVPPSTPTTAAPTPTPSTAPTVAAGGSGRPSAAPASTSSGAAGSTAPVAAPTELPRTGSENAVLALAGTVLLGGGAMLRRLSNRFARA